MWTAPFIASLAAYAPHRLTCIVLLKGYQAFNVNLHRRPPPPQGLLDVDLCGNQITLEGLRALCEGVAVCPTLAAVTLDSNDLREEGGRVSEDCEARCSGLEVMELTSEHRRAVPK